MSTVGTSCWKYPGPFGSWPSSALRSFIHRGLSARHLVRFGSVGVILASSIRPFGSWPSSTLYSSLHYELSARHVVGGIGGAHQGSSTNPPPTHHGVIKRVENHQQSTPPHPSPAISNRTILQCPQRTSFKAVAGLHPLLFTSQRGTYLDNVSLTESTMGCSMEESSCSESVAVL